MPCAREPPAQAEELVAVAVPAGDVDDHLLAGLGELRGEDLGAQHRVATRAVGDGEGGEPPVRAKLGRQRPDAGSASSPSRPRHGTSSATYVKQPVSPRLRASRDAGDPCARVSVIGGVHTNRSLRSRRSAPQDQP